MKIFLNLLLSLITVCSFGQELVRNTKTIRGFVFENQVLPQAYAVVYIKGTDTKITADKEGRFEIQAKVGDLLRAEYNGNYGEIYVTDKNCYKIYFKQTGLDILDRKLKRLRKKLARKTNRKSKQGYYDCKD